jgi:protein TonB
MPLRRFFIHCFESDGRPIWPLLIRESIGVTVVVAVVASEVVAARVQDLATVPITDEETAAVRWLAPLVKYAPPPPRQEHIEFVGLGSGPIAASTPTTSPRGDSQQPTPVAAAAASEASGQVTKVEEESTTDSARPLTEIEVDSAAALDPTAEGPVYPALMLKLHIEGLVLARFVVDTLGHADLNTFRVLQETDPEFVVAVRKALPKMKYRPAVLAGKRVPQLVEQPFTFRIRP